jgi:hypothetical protein
VGRVRSVAVPRNQLKVLIHKGLLAHSSPFRFLKRSRRVQNCSQLSRDTDVIFLRDVTVNTQGHFCIAMSQPLLPQFSGVFSRSIIDAAKCRKACSPQR